MFYKSIIIVDRGANKIRYLPSIIIYVVDCIIGITQQITENVDTVITAYTVKSRNKSYNIND